jgi:hypothetical protein
MIEFYKYKKAFKKLKITETIAINKELDYEVSLSVQFISHN